MSWILAIFLVLLGIGIGVFVFLLLWARSFRINF
nr:MAG TPA: hypothetical protein [Caudoviricetes sp.]